MAQTEMGAGIAASPHLHRPRICRCSLAWATRGPSLLFDPGSPDQASLPIVVPTEAGFSTFRGPSWVGPSASPAPRGSRELRQEDQLFRRLFRWSDLELAFLLIAIRWRSVLPSPAAPSCRFRPSGRRGLPSRSRVEGAKLFRVGKAKNASLCLWITGISGVSRDSRAGIPPIMASRRAK